MEFVGSHSAPAAHRSHRWLISCALLAAAVFAIGCPAPARITSTLAFNFVNDTDTPAELWEGLSTETDPANIVAARSSRQSTTVLDADPNPLVVGSIDLMAHVRVNDEVTTVSLTNVNYQAGKTTDIGLTWNGTTLRITAGSPR